MRAGLCTVSAPLAACRLPAAASLLPSARFLSLHLLSSPTSAHQQTLYFVVEAKSKVKEVYAQTCLHFSQQGMIDTQLFGLAIICDGEYLFVEAESKLSKYAPKNWRSSHTHGLDANGRPALAFYFRVQFYIDSPLLLQDDISRHYYYLQLRHNAASRTTSSSIADTAIMLAGLALQADVGDRNDVDRTENNGMLVSYFRPEDYVPVALRGPWGIQAIETSHANNRGLSRAEAELQYIQIACRLSDPINAHLFRLRSNKHEPTLSGGSILMSVCAHGIKISPDNNPTSTFLWSSIGKLSFDRKKFEIRTSHEKLTLFTTSDEKSKLLLQLCKDTHQFSMAVAPKLIEARKLEEEQQKRCYMLQDCYLYPRLINCNSQSSSRLDQRISVISNTSSNTTSGIVSDKVHSEDEVEIMINTPPLPPNCQTQSSANNSISTIKQTTSHGSSSCGSSTIVNDASLKTRLSIRSIDHLSSRKTSIDLDLNDDVSCLEQLRKENLTANNNSRDNIYCSTSSTVCTSQTSGIYTMASSQNTEIDEIDNSLETFRERSNSNLSNSSYSFHGDGSDPTDGQHQTFLSAKELSDMIVDQENNWQTQKNNPGLSKANHFSNSIDCILKHIPLLPQPLPPQHPPPPVPPSYPRKSPPPYPSARANKENAYKLPIQQQKQPQTLARQAPPPPPLPPLPLPPPQLPSTSSNHLQLRKAEIEHYQKTLNSNTDFVYFPAKEPSVSKQEYIDAKHGSRQMLEAALASSGRRQSPNNFGTKYASSHNLLLDKSLSLVKNDQLANFEEGAAQIIRTKSDDNILNSLSEKSRLTKTSLGAKNVIDFLTLREKSKNLDLPLISALCNDRNLIKQTKAFTIPKQPIAAMANTVTTSVTATACTPSAHPTSGRNSIIDLKKFTTKNIKNKYSISNNFDNLDKTSHPAKMTGSGSSGSSNHSSNMTTNSATGTGAAATGTATSLLLNGKKLVTTTIQRRNPYDKLPDIPRAAPNTYVINDVRLRNNVRKILKDPPQIT